MQKDQIVASIQQWFANLDSETQQEIDEAQRILELEYLDALDALDALDE